MPQYRKKPVVIEAFRAGIDPWPDWAWGHVNTNEITLHNVGEPTGYVEIKTLEGTMRADRGDWIIRGVKSEVYPCKPDIFAVTYEPVAFTPAHGTKG